MHALMTKTKISTEGNRYRSTLPRPIAEAIEMYDRENRYVAYTVVCAADGIEVEMRLAPTLEAGMNVLKAHVRDGGQVRLELPRFQIEAWGMAGKQFEWPDPEDIDVADDGSVTIRARVLDWEPPVEADLFAASAGFSYRSTISKSGTERSNIESHIPITLAEELDLADSSARARVSFDCIDGRKVMVVDKTEAGRSEVANSVSINLAGAQQRQARINAGRIAAEFDILDELDETSVPLRWGRQNGQVLAFVADEQ